MLQDIYVANARYAPECALAASVKQVGRFQLDQVLGHRKTTMDKVAVRDKYQTLSLGPYSSARYALSG